MTVIAWDGHTLAADKRRLYGDTILTTTKIERFTGNGFTELLGCVGEVTSSTALKEWYKSGCVKDNYPDPIPNEERILVVASKDKLKMFTEGPYPTILEEKYMAWGSGEEIAIGAMHMGADAIKAVKVASEHISSCGNGYDALTLD